MSPSEQLELKLPFIPWIFDHGPWAAIVGCVLVSHIYMMFLTNFGEDRRVREVFRIDNQYLGYLFGDLALAGAVGCFVYTLDDMKVDASSLVLTLGEILAVSIAFLAAWTFRVSERMRTPASIIVDQEARMPTKVYHDLFVMPLFVYVLTISIMASLAFAPWDKETMSYRFLGVSGLIAWFMLILLDSIPVQRKPKPYEYTIKNTRHHRLAKSNRSNWIDD